MRLFVKEVAAALLLAFAGANALAQDVSELKVAKPGSPEAKRLSDLRDLAKAGLIPVHQLGGGPAADDGVPAPVPTAFGMHLVPHAKAKSEMLRFQQRFASALAKQDTPTAARVAHFAWLPYIDHVRQIGWAGSVENTIAQPDGSVIVTVRVSPRLTSPTVKTLVLDYVKEVYLVSEGNIHLLNTDAANAKPHLQVFPVH